MVAPGNHFKRLLTKESSQHRNLLSHLGEIELERDRRERAA